MNACDVAQSKCFSVMDIFPLSSRRRFETSLWLLISSLPTLDLTLKTHSNCGPFGQDFQFNNHVLKFSSGGSVWHGRAYSTAQLLTVSLWANIFRQHHVGAHKWVPKSTCFAQCSFKPKPKMYLNTPFECHHCVLTKKKTFPRRRSRRRRKDRMALIIMTSEAGWRFFVRYIYSKAFWNAATVLSVV